MNIVYFEVNLDDHEIVKGVHLDDSPASRADREMSLVDGLQHVTDDEKITIRICYPLTVSSDRIVCNKGGWTKEDLAKTIAGEYQTIYDEEEDAIGDDLEPPYGKGPYGIWGHSLSDLILVKATRMGSHGVFELTIDS